MPIDQAKKYVAQESRIWKNMVCIQEVLHRRVTWSLQSETNQRNSIGFSSNISEALDNLDMSTTSEKDILTHINRTTKNLADTHKILTKK